jgi:hypothetical protein
VKDIQVRKPLIMQLYTICFLLHRFRNAFPLRPVLQHPQSVFIPWVGDPNPHGTTGRDIVFIFLISTFKIDRNTEAFELNSS